MVMEARLRERNVKLQCSGFEDGRNLFQQQTTHLGASNGHSYNKHLKLLKQLWNKVTDKGWKDFEEPNRKSPNCWDRLLVKVWMSTASKIGRIRKEVQNMVEKTCITVEDT